MRPNAAPSPNRPAARRVARLAAAFAVSASATLFAASADTDSAEKPPESPETRAMRVAAQADMAALETALTSAFLDLNRFVALENLDDVGFVTMPPANYIDNGSGPFVMRPERGLFESVRAPVAGVWNGPYINYQQGQTQAGTMPYDEGSPLDPWGNPYYFFSPLGLIRGDFGSVTLELYGSQFDRYAIVTLGPDLVQSGDDEIRLFGPGVTDPVVGSITGPRALTFNLPQGSYFQATPGWPVDVSGYNLGPTQNGSRVMWGTVELTGVTFWSPNRVTVDVPLGLAGNEDLRIEFGIGGQTNSLELRIPPNAARNWNEYD